MSLSTAIFYAAFIGQIILLSMYYPSKLYARLKYIQDNFPPDQYPKLYPVHKPEAAAWQLNNQLRHYKLFNAITLLVGIGLIITALVIGYDPMINDVEIIVVAYAMLQYLPVLMLEWSECKQLRFMRLANQSGKRVSTLEPRGLFDFVSKSLVLVALALIVANNVFDVFFVAEQDSLITKLLSKNLAHIVFIAVIIMNLYGRKRNPHQSHQDRMNQIGVVIKSCVWISIAASVFFLSNAIIDELKAAYLDPVLMSVYFQICGALGMGMMLRSAPIEKMDFEVYKANAVNS